MKVVATKMFVSVQPRLQRSRALTNMTASRSPRGYSALLENEGLDALWFQIVQDGAALLTKIGPGKPLPPEAALKNKVLRILDYL